MSPAFDSIGVALGIKRTLALNALGLNCSDSILRCSVINQPELLVVERDHAHLRGRYHCWLGDRNGVASGAANQETALLVGPSACFFFQASVGLLVCSGF